MIKMIPRHGFSAAPRFYGVMVSTQDSESCDPSSNLGRTCIFNNLRKTYGSGGRPLRSILMKLCAVLERFSFIMVNFLKF